MRIEDMTPEMIEKIRGCETDEGRRAVLEENGIELDDEQLDGIAGGVFDSLPVPGTKDLRF
jgi:hypothetical protein